ncbi:hypothetical protein BDA96_03G402100 [Sorghum bicolor]|uniref:Uncharacterized protein n=1 Tax=Sorghum bicolor TaxID=4558 RepID=A0A921RJQ7_SORBI|nr:hypothetical protein BDA96_03G402100 [Sorghum bicolor]
MEFETFEDKSRAINADTGVNKRLADMIYKWRLSGMKLAVGKPEYKTIIESKLGIPCTHNAIVMEVMRGHTASNAQVSAYRKSRGG